MKSNSNAELFARVTGVACRRVLPGKKLEWKSRKFGVLLCKWLQGVFRIVDSKPANMDLICRWYFRVSWGVERPFEYQSRQHGTWQSYNLATCRGRTWVVWLEGPVVLRCEDPLHCTNSRPQVWWREGGHASVGKIFLRPRICHGRARQNRLQQSPAADCDS